MKVFDLQCEEHGHIFEGWFASHDDYDSQQARGLVSCPVCGGSKVVKRLSAPRLNVGHFREPAASPAAGALAATVAEPSGEAMQMARLQAEIFKQVREMVRRADNVGARFAEEARRIHYGDAEDRAIRGTSTPEERAELAEEGIDVLGLPDIFDDERLQ
ncbi:DUF1178 family protein [Achromobacter aloeverae]|uniref:DUF1178 domain-containing protein n=1 Tax=Achromobacter aloeverae TaxID=1750518 RepID=A0A4Q1HR84_9BURK|nr:DUF1178 family protein [Achromobacter aloeverae]RXN93211.1 DUF1178 domain-containing protein [Achromobacter aloeverae]